MHRRTTAALVAACLAALVAPTGPAGSLSTATAATTAPRTLPAVGSVVRSEPLPRHLWIPRSTSRAWRLTYVTRDSHGRRALSSGTVFIPFGTPPRGGWPVVSWAHGISGLGDDCAPSKVGPVLKHRDWSYLRTWMRQGYAIVASDYVGLGTPGLMPYLDTRATAHNVVDIVKAGHSFTADKKPRLRLARKWVTIGQSQGGGGAVGTARYATRFGGRTLSYRGAVGTGTPAYIEDYVELLGPEVPPLTGDLTAYLTYIVASLRDVHPELGIDDILTPTGKKYVRLAETVCDEDFAAMMEGVAMGTFFTLPMAALPGFRETVVDYMGMPESGFDKPFFMGHGAADVDVPYAQTLRYATVLQANGEPVVFKTYPTDHSGTMAASLEDTIPFVRKAMR